MKVILNVVRTSITVGILVAASIVQAQDQQDGRIKMAVAGLSHDHVHWLLNEHAQQKINLVGIAESDEKLVNRYQNQYDLDHGLFFSSLEKMLDTVMPDAVLAFNPIIDHLEVVRQCASRGIHVMVEKPLAVNMKHAIEMKELAGEHGIHLLTNYETTWYSSNHKAYEMITDENIIGDIRKVVVHDGHQGPKEIGVSREFLEWLTDPVKNGGGAIMDFGCYGANLITWLMNNQKPVSVTAVTQQIKPELYPNVDDEATIILTYPKTTGIIQASWNWPVNRKDIEIYGKNGYIFCKDRNHIMVRNQNNSGVGEQKIPERGKPFDDPFSYLEAVVKGEITTGNRDLSSLENNMIVVEILDAARKSAESGRTIMLR